MAAYWLKASKDKAGRSDLAAKYWGLFDAYKQNPLSDQAYEKDADLAVFNPETGSEAASAKHTDMYIASLFSFLGWRLSEDKLVPFSSVCSVGGSVALQRSQVGFGLSLQHRGKS